MHESKEVFTPSAERWLSEGRQTAKKSLGSEHRNIPRNFEGNMGFSEI